MFALARLAFGSSRTPGWCDQEADQRPQVAFATVPDIVDEFKESQIRWQALLRDSSARTKPTPQQRPKSFEGVDVDLTEPVSVIITGVLTRAMADRVMSVAPLGESTVDVTLIGVDDASLGNRRLNQRTDCRRCWRPGLPPLRRIFHRHHPQPEHPPSLCPLRRPPRPGPDRRDGLQLRTHIRRRHAH